MNKSKKITINLSFYNQNQVLRQHVMLWKSWSEDVRNQFAFCIIDDCSKISALDILQGIDLNDIDVSIYRVEEDLVCNIAGVRNLAATVCETEWMVILDMDTMITEQLANSMLQLITQDSGLCFKFNRRVSNNPNHNKNNQMHPAVCLIRKDDYWSVGGCEEDLVGHYGQTDPIFWYRARGKLNIQMMNNLYLEYIPAGEADIIRNTAHNQKVFQEKIKNNSWSTDFVRFSWKKVK